MTLARGWENTVEDITPYQGFVYVIINEVDGRYYIGKKFYWKSLRRKPLKGKKRVRLDKKESDWKTYYGSSKELQEDIQRYGKDKFRRIIYKHCDTKWDCMYWELWYQMTKRVLFDEKSYNGIIHVRLKKKVMR